MKIFFVYVIPVASTKKYFLEDWYIHEISSITRVYAQMYGNILMGSSTFIQSYCSWQYISLYFHAKKFQRKEIATANKKVMATAKKSNSNCK